MTARAEFDKAVKNVQSSPRLWSAVLEVVPHKKSSTTGGKGRKSLLNLVPPCFSPSLIHGSGVTTHLAWFCFISLSSFLAIDSKLSFKITRFNIIIMQNQC